MNRENAIQHSQTAHQGRLLLSFFIALRLPLFVSVAADTTDDGVRGARQSSSATVQDLARQAPTVQ